MHQKNKIENIGKLLYPEEIKNLTGALNIVKGLERKTEDNLPCCGTRPQSI